MTITGSRPTDSNKLYQLASDLYSYTSGVNRNNYSPIFHRPISQHTGLRITGDFMTDDDSTEGQMSYITVLRHSPQVLGDVVVPYDGLGLAWRKQIGGKYNVYIVDNNALSEEVHIGKNVIVEDYGINSFLAAAQVDININTWYSFRIDINENLGINAWIWRTSSGPPNFLSVNRTIYMGVTYPNYVPSATGQHFGLSVMNTRGSQWWYKNIIVKSIIDNYPAHLFQIYANPSKYSDGEGCNLVMRAIGFGPDRENDNRARIVIRRELPAQSWETLGEVTAKPSDDPKLQTLEVTLDDIRPYRNAANYINVVAQPINSGITHTLRSYYVALEPIIPSGVHLGNVVDVYVNAPTRIVEETLTFIAGENTVLENVLGMHVPIQELLNIAPTGVPATWSRGEEWTLSQGSPTKAWSVEADSILNLSPTLVSGLPLSIDLTYRYYLDGELLQSVVSGQSFRYPGADVLAKIYPPTVVTLNNFTYRSGLAADDMKLRLTGFINSGITDGRLELSDLINVAYTNGASWVDTSTVDIGLRYYEIDGTLHNVEFDDLYLLSGHSSFFTTVTELAGVRRL